MQFVLFCFYYRRKEESRRRADEQISLLARETESFEGTNSWPEREWETMDSLGREEVADEALNYLRDNPDSNTRTITVDPDFESTNPEDSGHKDHQQDTDSIKNSDPDSDSHTQQNSPELAFSV